MRNLGLLLFQILVVLAAAHAVGRIFRTVKQRPEQTEWLGAKPLSSAF